MRKLIPPARPNRDKTRIGAVLKHFKIPPQKVALVFVRGHYLDSMGEKGKNDINIYDDSCFLVNHDFTLFESYNANTDPSFTRRGGRALASLNLGLYDFYRGQHRNKYNALRAFPDGVVLPCTRDGKPSTCQYINIHKGGTSMLGINVTFSEGCLTIPDIQFGDFIARVYDAMRKNAQSTIPVILIENKQTKQGQRWHDESGRIIA
jgi:lysozyme